MVLVLLDQLQIFQHLHLIELLGAFNRSGGTEAVALDISKAFDRVWHAVHAVMEFQVRYLALFLLFHSNRRLRVVLDG